MEDGVVKHPSDRRCFEMIEQIRDGDPLSRFLAVLTRGLAACQTPTAEQIKQAWARVAFTNCVYATVGAGARVRPGAELRETAKLQFPKLLVDLKPRTIIVLGTRCGTACRRRTFGSPTMSRATGI